MRDRYIPRLFPESHFTETIIHPRPKPTAREVRVVGRRVQCTCRNAPKHWLEGHFRCPWCGKMHRPK